MTWSGYESGFDAGYAKGYADGLDECANDPRVERIEEGFKAMFAATNGEYSREDMVVLDALQAGREFAVRLAHREQHISQLIEERDASRKHTVDAVIQAVAELPDRTSPDDWPEAMLVTAEELRAILSAVPPPAEARELEKP